MWWKLIIAYLAGVFTVVELILASIRQKAKQEAAKWRREEY